MRNRKIAVFVMLAVTSFLLVGFQNCGPSEFKSNLPVTPVDGPEDQPGNSCPAPTSPSSGFYASPEGAPTGDGSIDSPWDLITALGKTSEIGAGDTLYLRGGTYVGRFSSLLSGDVNAPVVIRPYPGETAVLDANIVLSMDPVNDTVTDITIRGDDLRMLSNNSIITVVSDSGVESIRLVSLTQDNGTSRVYSTCDRGYLSTTALSHSSNIKVYISSLATLKVKGSYSEVRNLIVKNSNPYRSSSISGSKSQFRGSGLDVEGDHSRIINNIIKDNGVGIGFWKTATDSKLYGNLIFNNGWVGPDRSHGHGIYSQNLPDGSRKLIRHNLIYNNFRIGMNIYGSAAAHAVNYDIEQNVIANNSAPSSYPGNPKGLTADYRDWGVLVGTGNPSDSIFVIGNHFYNPTSINVGQHLRAGYLTHGNLELKIKENHFIGGQSGFQVEDWSNVEVKNNLVAVFAKGVHITKDGLNPSLPYTDPFILNNHIFENNEYLHYRPNTDDRYFTLTDVGFYPMDLPGGGLDSWLELVHNSATVNTFENGSTYKHEDLDFSSYQVWPNEEQEDLSYLVVHNHNGSSSINISLSDTHLQVGDKFKVVDLQSKQTVYTGEVLPSDIDFSLPIDDLGVVQPVGLEALDHLKSTTLEFGLYSIENLSECE